MSAYAPFRPAALLLAGLLLGWSGCTQRRLDADEVVKACEQACPLKFECGFASEGKTLEDCLESCPANYQSISDACRADFEHLECLSTLSCEEYFEQSQVQDERRIGTFGDPPSWPCQAEFIARVRECDGFKGDI